MNKETSTFLLQRFRPKLLSSIYLSAKYNCVVDPSATIFFPSKVKLGKSTVIRKATLIAKTSKSKGIVIGENSLIDDYVILHSRGDSITLGDHVHINPFCVIDGHGNVKIGNNVGLASHVRLVTNHVIPPSNELIRNQPITKKGIKIGDDVWVGTGVTIVDGVSIGDGCIIGAGSVVLNDTPAYTISAGVPSKIIRKRQ
ncbi:2,3,4,5-tetrahydropyridine-2,6-dicarboxylate N-acetyltransferase [uncultured archaeon]|nr:2,3,4,5-tetrahydropyridine-2,6-dicarboxylate N-acetyltransferase [uncultured archaeon]